ncbi:MAG: hypothetical protein K8S14_00530, partial [Actinomycetia bacterium]|nr:hypothetical protein [Actinomycetes bacterium]
MNSMHWPLILAQKAFWVYYLRLFQGFGGDRVAACCDFFGVDKTGLEDAILHNLYQTHRYDEEDTVFHILSLPTTAGAAFEIEFQNGGPNEHLRLVAGEEQIPLADVDVDDVRAPLFPLRDLPRVAARLRGELAQTYGALLLYKISGVTPEDDLDALAEILRAALPPGMFSEREQTRILNIEGRTWQMQQRRPCPLRVV